MAQAKDVVVGQVWTARVSGRDVQVRVEGELPSRGRKLFSLLNLSTNRMTTGTAGKLKRLVGQHTMPDPTPSHGPRQPITGGRLYVARSYPEDGGHQERRVVCPGCRHTLNSQYTKPSEFPRFVACRGCGTYFENRDGLASEEPQFSGYLVSGPAAQPPPAAARRPFVPPPPVTRTPVLPRERGEHPREDEYELEDEITDWSPPAPRLNGPNLSSLRGAGTLPRAPRRSPPARQNPSAYPSQLAAATAQAIARSDGTAEGIVLAVRAVLRI